MDKLDAFAAASASAGKQQTKENMMQQGELSAEGHRIRELQSGKKFKEKLADIFAIPTISLFFTLNGFLTLQFKHF
jgi:hypothetical protein